MQPFSITLFATAGDLEGIRHFDKSNWSGYSVVFTKNLFHLLKQEPSFSQAGIYTFGKRHINTVWTPCWVSVRFDHLDALFESVQTVKPCSSVVSATPAPD